MRITKNDVPTRFDVPGATVRQQTDFGNADGYAALGAEYFSLAAGTDIAPLLKGLQDDACQAPHWGFLISGELHVSYVDGTAENVGGQDLFYWPPGHSVRVVDDAEVILFSPQAEHGAVLDHMVSQMSASA